MAIASLTRAQGTGSVSTSGSAFTPYVNSLEGDFRVLTVFSYSTTITWGISSGQGWAQQYSNASNNMRLTVWSSFQPSDPDTLPNTVITPSASVECLRIMWYVRGVHETDPYMIAPSASTVSGGTTGTTLAGVSMTPADPGGLALWFYGFRASSSVTTRTITEPSGVSYPGEQVRPTTGTTGYVGRASGLLTTEDVATGTKNTTASVSSPWRTIGLVLRPEPEEPEWAPWWGEQFLVMA